METPPNQERILKTDTDRRYTLAEAERVLAQRACAHNGHDFTVITSAGGSAPTLIVCDRCGTTWAVANSTP